MAIQRSTARKPSKPVGQVDSGFNWEDYKAKAFGKQRWTELQKSRRETGEEVKPPAGSIHVAVSNASVGVRKQGAKQGIAYFRIGYSILDPGDEQNGTFSEWFDIDDRQAGSITAVEILWLRLSQLGIEVDDDWNPMASAEQLRKIRPAARMTVSYNDAGFMNCRVERLLDKREVQELLSSETPEPNKKSRRPK